MLAPWADQIHEWLGSDRLQLTRVHELLADRGCRVSYTSLRRFIQRRGWQRRSPTTVRMGESAPGDVAEMDFGRLIGFRVAGSSKAQHLGSQRLRCRVGCSASTMTVSDCGCSLLPVSRQDAPGVACAHSHQRGRLLQSHVLCQ